MFKHLFIITVYFRNRIKNKIKRGMCILRRICWETKGVVFGIIKIYIQIAQHRMIALFNDEFNIGLSISQVKYLMIHSTAINFMHRCSFIRASILINHEIYRNCHGRMDSPEDVNREPRSNLRFISGCQTLDRESSISQRFDLVPRRWV